jgi:protein involved in polysaccharide export with SLBB domain
MRHRLDFSALLTALLAVLICTSAVAASFRVEGKVGKPGSYEVRDNLTPAQALTEAGGASDGADLSSAYIQRGQNTINVDLSKPADGTSTVVMQEGDTLVVPSLNISVTGEVKRPGMYALIPGKADRLQDAIRAAGGVTDKANLKKVQITTTIEGKKKTVTIDATSPQVNPVLIKGDLVFIPGPDQKHKTDMNDLYTAAVVILMALSLF